MEREKKEKNIKCHTRHLTYLNNTQLNKNSHKILNTQLNLSNNIKKENWQLNKLVADYELKTKQYEIEEKKKKIKMYKNQFLNNKNKFNENSLIIKELKDNIKNEINRSLLIRNNTNHEKNLSNISDLKRKTLFKSNQKANFYTSFPKNVNTSIIKKKNVKKNDISLKNVSQTSRTNSKIKNKNSDISVLKNKKEKKKECNLTMNDKSNYYFDENKSLNLAKNEKEENNKKNERDLKNFQNKKNVNKINQISNNNNMNKQLKKSSSRKKSKYLVKNNSVGNVQNLFSVKPNQSLIINNYNSFNYINVYQNNNKIEVKQNKKFN